MTCKGNYWYNSGQSLDTMQFIPKTKKADERKQLLAGQTNLTALEKWSLNQVKNGNRNHTLARYAFTLEELGHDKDSIRNKVMKLNREMSNPLDDAEIVSTIMVSVGKRIDARGE